MPKAKADPKKTAKSKPKIQTKSKARTKPKVHAKTKAHVKSKVHTKSKTQAKPKTHAKSKAHVAAKNHRKPKSSSAKLKKPTSKFEFDDIQAETLLMLVEEIVSLRKMKQGGLKSFYGIDRILNRYNQHFTHPIEKLDAIVKYGMEKDPSTVHQHFYVVVDGREKDEDDLYHLLTGIGTGKIKFEDAKNKMIDLYQESSHEK